MDEFVKETSRGMKTASNKREIRISADSNNRETTVNKKLFGYFCIRLSPIKKFRVVNK